MRLVCPNCDAEYEVDASVIPDGGRDVQCSNCGHAWFQISPEVEAEIAAEEALYEPPPALAEAAPHPDEPDHPAQPDLKPQSIDASVLAVLKEEADREVEARRAEAPPMEVQTDMSLQAPAAEAGGLGAVARRLARMKGVEAVRQPLRSAVRSDAFPEIEEINSTLRASSEKRSGSAAVVAEPAQKASGGFRSGFVLMLLLAVVIVAVYVMAPKLAQQMPAAAGPLMAYVAFIDAARLTLDDAMKSAITFLRGLAGGNAA
ncbi:MAG: zinc-ribbon domain-containing protein [Cypionkella sp.]